MTAVADPIASLRKHLESNTTPDLAIAFELIPHFCRKFFTLEKLIDLLRKEAPILRSGNAFDLLRDEIVRRLLIAGDRARWRATLLDLLRLDAATDPLLLCFVEQFYQACGTSDFAASEGEYLNGLQDVYEARSPLGGPISDALAWFAALPGHSGGPRFRVLFSNQAHHGRYPDIFAPGICVAFSFTKTNSTEPFARYDVDRLGNNFRRAAEEAEIKAYELCGKTFGTAKHRRVRIEDNLEDLSILDGTSGYLAFLMIHLCLMKGVPVSPYIGFTGSFKDFQRLDRVADLPQKIAAAIDVGMRVLFVPQSNYSCLSAGEREAGGLLRIVPYDERMSVEKVAGNLADQLLALQAEFTPVTPSAPRIEDPPPKRASVPIGPPPVPEAAPIAEPQKLFRASQLGSFLECGGYDGLQSPAKMSVFNSEDDCFVAIFPGKKRVYRFDSFGALYEKFRCDAMPLCIAWDEDRSEYVIGFEDRRVQRLSAQLEPRGSLPLPEQIEPRLLACGGGYLYASDMSERIVRLDRNGRLTHGTNLNGKVCDLTYSEARQSLIASVANCLVGLDPELNPSWKIEHFAGKATATATPTGDLWVALASGRLWRLAAPDNQKLVDISVPPGVSALAAIEGAVAIGTFKGQILLYDSFGRKMGSDELQTAIYHVCATEGGMLVLSTAKGPTVVKPRTELALRTREQIVREHAHATLLEWERAALSAASLHRLLKENLRGIDLAHWQEVCVLQSLFSQRRAIQPAIYDKIEAALRFIDPRKSARLAAKTRPVIIDGSNVSRHHWGNDRKGKKARLAAILRLREQLSNEVNPVLYPLVVVVDVTERHHTDDLASLKRLIDDGEILETPSEREADALIFNLIKTNGWLDCHIVSNDRRMFEAHSEMLPGADRDWYAQVRMAFAINPRTHEVYFPERSIR